MTQVRETPQTATAKQPRPARGRKRSRLLLYASAVGVVVILLITIIRVVGSSDNHPYKTTTVYPESGYPAHTIQNPDGGTSCSSDLSTIRLRFGGTLDHNGVRISSQQNSEGVTVKFDGKVPALAAIVNGDTPVVVPTKLPDGSSLYFSVKDFGQIQRVALCAPSLS